MHFGIGHATVVAVAISVTVSGCPDPHAQHRAKVCSNAGVSPNLVEECRRSETTFSEIMKPIRQKWEQEEIERFNAGLQRLPPVTIPPDRYHPLTLGELAKNHCCFLVLVDEDTPKHPLYRNQVVVQGSIEFHPVDFSEKSNEHLDITADDPANANNTWHLDADIESLARIERSFLRRYCKAPMLYGECNGSFYGTIGVLARDPLPVLGLQVEHMELTPRQMAEHP